MWIITYIIIKDSTDVPIALSHFYLAKNRLISTHVYSLPFA